jgi:hypothetical protein
MPERKQKQVYVPFRNCWSGPGRVLIGTLLGVYWPERVTIRLFAQPEPWKNPAKPLFYTTFQSSMKTAQEA